MCEICSTLELFNTIKAFLSMNYINVFVRHFVWQDNNFVDGQTTVPGNTSLGFDS